ncbi:MAG TPA: oxygen-independent coproporphyrinogen III oxidase [Candidatus Krumholzibacteria bacterium]|nr:oxygen-independent coproporphyrinogen III oxidase [Candidatus Krumholzibacteria bacterium]
MKSIQPQQPLPEPELTPELIRRFDRPGPRYTSYPTAVEFHAGVGEADYAGKLAAADARSSEPLSLYFHLPFCHERCTFCGCHVIITKKRERALEYLGYLQRELDLVCKHLPHRRRVAQYHWGGGTPTYYTPAEMRQLHQAVLDRFEILPEAEVAIEIDPRVTTHEHIDVLREFGFNRLSMGVQDFTPEVQAIISRYQDEPSTHELYAHCRRQGFDSINVDLIYGLPLQTLDTFARTLDSILDMRPDRVAMYSFAFVPWKSGNQNVMTEDMLPPPELKVDLYLLGLRKFVDAGYVQIGMDHFALPGDELARALHHHALHRNFMGYTTKPASDSIAFGVSGIGDLQGAYIQNQKAQDAYYEALRAARLPVLRGVLLSRDDEIRRYLITQIMCNFHLDGREVGRRFGLDFETTFAAELEALREHETNGFLRLRDHSIEVTRLGRVFIRNIAMVFDKYLEGKKSERTFSRTI